MATILAIAGVGAWLAALHVRLFRLLNVRIRDVDSRVAGVEERLERRIAGVEERLEQRMTGLEREMSDVRERMAKLEGAVTGSWRATAWAPPDRAAPGRPSVARIVM